MNRLLINEQQLELLAKELATKSNITMDDARQSLLNIYFALYPKQPDVIEEEKTVVIPNRADRRKR